MARLAARACAAPRLETTLLAATLLAATLLGALACSEAGSTAAPRATKAHLLLVSVDTLRADHLGCYGAADARTPHLDALAREGLVALQATSASNQTATSHATLFTGASAPVHGVVNVTPGAAPGTSVLRAIPPSLATIAECLRDAGFVTAAETDAGYVSEPFGFARGFDEFRAELTLTAPKVERALAWFDRLPADRRGFYFLHTYETHAPYRIEREAMRTLLDRYQRTAVAPRLLKILEEPGMGLGPACGALFDQWESFGPRDFECLRELYRGAVESVDRSIGDLVAGLRARGLLERTVVVVTSDHGEEFHEHGGVQHGSPFDEVLRVPFVARLPGAALAGARKRSSFGAVHVLPTVLDLLGVRAPDGIEGRSHWPAWSRGADAPEEAVAYASHLDNERWIADVARTPRWKVVRSRQDPVERRDRHYDLVADPLEQRWRPQARTGEAASLVRDLGVAQRVWDAMATHHESQGGATTSAPLPPEIEDQLRALGYAR